MKIIYSHHCHHLPAPNKEVTAIHSQPPGILIQKESSSYYRWMLPEQSLLQINTTVHLAHFPKFQRAGLPCCAFLLPFQSL